MITMKTTIATLAFAATTALSGCGVGEANIADSVDIEAASQVPVEVAYATRADIYATYEATTTIASDADAPVLARAAGDVVDLLVEEGDQVRRGQILARLDGERLRLEMLAAKANLDQRRGEYERNFDLHGRGLVSASTFEGLKYDLDALEATYSLKKLNYDYSSIRAPIAGVVSARNIKLGQNIGINDVTFRITDPSELIAYLQIPQAEHAKFIAGHSASLQVDALPGIRFEATIIRISPTIDVRNGTFRATAFIANENGNLAPGMFARFRIAYEKHEAALVIPARALVEEDDRTSVYVVEAGEVSRRTIETGIESGGQIEILSGLAEDDQIVVVGQSGLRDGSKVLASMPLEDGFAG